MKKETKVCPKCGRRYPENYRYCGHCVDEEDKAVALVAIDDVQLQKITKTEPVEREKETPPATPVEIHKSNPEKPKEAPVIEPEEFDTPIYPYQTLSTDILNEGNSKPNKRPQSSSPDNFDNDGNKPKKYRGKAILILLILGALIIGGIVYGPAAMDSLTQPEYHTVTFDTGGVAAIPSVIVKSGSKVSQPSLPSRSGYSFDGWYTASGKLWNFNKDVITTDTKLYARWVKYNSFNQNPYDPFNFAPSAK